MSEPAKPRKARVREGYLTPLICRTCDRLVVRTEIDGLVIDLEPRLVDGNLEGTAWKVGLTTYEVIWWGRQGVWFNWRNPGNQEIRPKEKVAVRHLCPSAP